MFLLICLLIKMMTIIAMCLTTRRYQAVPFVMVCLAEHILCAVDAFDSFSHKEAAKANYLSNMARAPLTIGALCLLLILSVMGRDKPWIWLVRVGFCPPLI